MSAHNIYDGIMPATAGQSAGRVIVEIDGVRLPVVSVRLAACSLNLSVRYTRRLCDEGKLIAIKMDGRWWVLERAIEIWPQTALLRLPEAS